MQQSPQNLSWHLFCRVVDNYGDIGVCWRLARQLTGEFERQVTLWVDDLTTFAALEPRLNAGLSQQCLEGIAVRHWAEPFPLITGADVGDVVIEAFGCDLPEIYLAAMQVRRPQWLNLEYLTAEPWVKSCHLAPSPRFGLTKRFFYPGFEPGTGGLLWEPELLQLANAEPSAQALSDLLVELAVAVPALSHQYRASLFGYANPAVTTLLDAAVTLPGGLHLLVPEGKVMTHLQPWVGETLTVGQTWSRGALSITVLPFMSQPQYDRLLTNCHLNFVRGEDSFVRTQMLARPFVWHIYPQEEGAHIDKLQALVDLLADGLEPELKILLTRLFLGWNQAGGCSVEDWYHWFAQMPLWQRHARLWQEKLIGLNSLALNLVTQTENGV